MAITTAPWTTFMPVLRRRKVRVWIQLWVRIYSGTTNLGKSGPFIIIISQGPRLCIVMVLLQELGYRHYRYAAVPNDDSVISSASSDNSEASISAWPHKISLRPVRNDGSKMGNQGYNKNGRVWNENTRSPRLHQLEKSWNITTISPRYSNCASPRRRETSGFSRSKRETPVKRLGQDQDLLFSEAQQYDQDDSLSPSPVTENDCKEEVRDPQELVRTRTRDRFKVTLPAATVKKTCLRLMKGDSKVEDEYDDIEFIGTEKLRSGDIQRREKQTMIYRKQDECHQGGATGRNDQYREEDQVEFLGFESIDKQLEHQLQFKEEPRIRIQKIISVVKTLSPRNEKRAVNDSMPKDADQYQAGEVEEFPPTAEDDGIHQAEPQPKDISIRLKSRSRRRKRKTNRGRKQFSKNFPDAKTVEKDSESVESVALLCQWLQCAEIEGVDPMCSRGDPRGMIISTSRPSKGTISFDTSCTAAETEEHDSNDGVYETTRYMVADIEEQDTKHYAKMSNGP